jgi:MoxR-like ATPase
MSDWKIFTGKLKLDADPDYIVNRLPAPPPWRTFGDKSLVAQERRHSDQEELAALERKGSTFRTDDVEATNEDNVAAPKANAANAAKDENRQQVIEMVNAALYLRRPLLITGKPGTGKSSLIHAVAYELQLGGVLEWPITSRSTLQQGLYSYDAIGRLQDKQSGDTREIQDYLQLGPLGTALLPTRRPRALLIDEIDKGDLDLPNDLLFIFEQGKFTIPELQRLKSEKPLPVRDHTGKESFPILNGEVRCHQFPFVVMTSNGEREFPAPFLRRCLQLRMEEPSTELLKKIVEAHLEKDVAAQADKLIAEFVKRRKAESLATDQLLNAIHLVKGNHGVAEEDQDRLINALLKALTSGN